jgi:DNA-binding SARP family transcriptional activator
MLFRALGTVSVVDDDGVVTTLRAGRQRALLALLMLEPNSLITRSSAIDALWGHDLPAHPEAALQIVMSRLRGQLGDYGHRIRAERTGYRLDAGPDEVDVLWAESLLRDGRSALAAGDFGAAADAFEQALDYWTGPALADVGDYPFAAASARRLQELRIALVEARNDAYLGGGRHLEVLSDADSWIAMEPLREHLRAQQVVALYRGGRQADALRACEDLRKQLRDELGLEPSSEMQALERRVLDQDQSVGAHDSGLLTPLPEWTAQILPFVGRAGEQERVVDALREASRGTMRLMLVTGEAGVGKSRFLLHVARTVARDSIVIPLHINHLWESTLHALARAVAEATLAFSDEELQVIARDVPEAPRDAGALRSIAHSLISREGFDEILGDTLVLESGARWIAALSARAPVVLLVDDFDTAGTPLNHIVAKLAVLSLPKRVLVVGAARGPLEQTAPQVAQLVAAGIESGFAETMNLANLAPEDIDALLARMRVAPRGELVERLMALTGGHPLLLAEILGSGPVERVVNDWPTRPRVADVVRRRTAELGQATSDVLRAASLFESDFTVELLAELLGASEATVARLVDRAVDAHVLQPTTATSYRFAHRTYRQTLLRDLAVERRTSGHRQIATMLEQRGDAPAAVLAAHWAGASGDDVPGKLATYARAAAREAMALSEPHSAVHWLDFATPHVSEHDRGPLLVELAEAQQLAGDSRGVESLCEAVRIALDTNDDELIRRIVGAQLPAWSTLPGVAGPATRQLLARALDIVHEDGARSRVTAWLAADIALYEPVDGIALMNEAIMLARSSGDRDALTECLIRYAAVAASPHMLSGRRAAIHELLDIVRPLDIATRYFAWSSQAVIGIQRADIGESDAAIAEADALSTQYDLRPIRWSQKVRNAWRIALVGDPFQASQQIRSAAHYGNQAGIPAAEGTALLQDAFLQWQQGGLAQHVAEIRKTHGDLSGAFPELALILARALADDPNARDEARSIVERFAKNDFADVQLGPFWSSLLLITAETAALMKMAEASATVRDLLLPFADQVAHPGMWVAGPIAYGIAVACLGCSDPRASHYIERAVDTATRLGAPLLAEQARRAVTLQTDR